MTEPDLPWTEQRDDDEAVPPASESAAAVAPYGDPRVADAVRRLDELSDLPPAEHVEVYEAVHSRLQESLAEASNHADPPRVDLAPADLPLVDLAPADEPADGTPPS